VINFNRVSNLEDFRDPDLLDVIRDVFAHKVRDFGTEFPHSTEHRKYWQIGMTILAFKHFGVLHPEAMVLGVGAGKETTIYYLANHVKQVFATDRYFDPKGWDLWAPGRMLVEPEKFAPYSYQRQRLVVQHMDGRLLEYEDNTFDGIFSSGSIGHFGGLKFVSNAAYEMGRVLKPNGILSLSTEFMISGPGQGNAWDSGRLLLSSDDIQKYIVEASGLEMVDNLTISLSEQTLATDQPLVPAAEFMPEMTRKQSEEPEVVKTYDRAAQYPFLVLSNNGYKFCSIHLTLKKPDDYPAQENNWAKPTEITRKAVKESSRVSTEQSDQPSPPLQGVEQHLTSSHLTALQREFTNLRSSILLDPAGRRLPEFIGAMYRTIRRVIGLGKAWEIQKNLYGALVVQNQILEKNYETLALRYETLEKAIEQTRSVAKYNSLQLGLSEHELQSNEKSIIDSKHSALTSHDLIQLMMNLEQEVTELSEAISVKFSIDGEPTDEIALGGTENLESRRSLHANNALRDAWYVIDYSHDWQIGNIYSEALRILKPGGFLVLVTHIDDNLKPSTSGISLHLDKWFTLSSGRNIRVIVLQCPKAVPYVMREGFTLLVKQDGGPIQQQIENDRFWEQEETDFLKSVINPGDIFVDVGANIGYFTMLAANLVGASGHIFAVEPDPINAAILRWNVQSLRAPRKVTIVEAAVSDVNGIFNLYISPVNFADHRLFPTNNDPMDNGQDRKSIPVKTMTLDEIIPYDQRVDIVKVDVQGSELAALKGMQRIIRRWSPTILLELWPYGLKEAGDNPRELPTMLVNLGYDLYKLSQPLESVSSLEDEIVSFQWWQNLNIVAMAKK